MVEEAYVTLQLNELQYIYEGDSIDVTYQIGDFWTDLIDLIAAYKIAKAVVEGVRTATASQPFTAAMIPGIVADVATDTGFWIGVAALIGNNFIKKLDLNLEKKLKILARFGQTRLDLELNTEMKVKLHILQMFIFMA